MSDNCWLAVSRFRFDWLGKSPSSVWLPFFSGGSGVSGF